jgi:HAD superfamily hydrolase (TIGR01509 family)
MRGRYEAVLFDLDGVVIDTRQSVTAFWTAFAAEQGVTLTADDFNRHIFGVPAVHTLKTLFPAIPRAQYEGLHERILDYETQLRYAEIRGAVALLRALKTAGIPTALVTSGETSKVAEVVRQLALGGLFEVVVTAADIERGKPDPACYLTAAHRLGVATTRCVAFEDAVTGVRAAIGAGAFCVGVQAGRMAGQLVAEGVGHVIPDFAGVRLAPSESVGEYLLRANEQFALTAGQQPRCDTPNMTQPRLHHGALTIILRSRM